jgi:MFS superfamily sulfate permease-like transporter
VVVGIALSLLLVVRQTTLPRMTLFGVVGQGDSERFAELDEDPQARPVAGLMLVKIDESLHFANTGQASAIAMPVSSDTAPARLTFSLRLWQLRDMLQRIEMLGRMDIHPSSKVRVPSVRGVIFDVKDMVHCDASAVQILLEIVADYRKRGIKVCLVHLRDASKRIFLRSGLCFPRSSKPSSKHVHTRPGLLDLIGTEATFSNKRDAKLYVEGHSRSYSTYAMTDAPA